MTEIIELRNHGSADTADSRGLSTLYYPRLMVNDSGEVVLALYKKGTLTTGILVDNVEGKTPRPHTISGASIPIGTKWTDWEVGGDLRDYDGEVTITLQNETRN